MIKINEEFNCKQCNTFNPPAEKTCRNHCFNCLFSLHLDDEIPGDRAANCHGLMQPIRIEHNSKKGFQILHSCRKCNKTILNKSLPDDNIETITKIIQMQNWA